MNTFNPENRALEIFAQYQRENLNEQLEEYYKLIETLIYLNEILRETNFRIQYWEKYSETLLFKLAMHGMTVYDILSGHVMKSRYYPEFDKGIKIIDSASAKVVLRSQLETFLMYNYIYVNPQNEDLKELRYHAWIYSGLLNRQQFPAETEFGKTQKQKDQKELEKIKKRIRELNSYQQLSDKQKTALFNTGSGKLFSHWGSILKETGFDEKHVFSIIYNHWSIYSHAEGISAVQLSGTAFNYSKQNKDCLLDLQVSKFMICLMIKTIVTRYNVIKERYESLPESLKFDISFYTKQAYIASMGS